MGEARRVMDAMTDATLQSDLEAAANLYAPDAVAVTPDQGELRGREQIIQYLKEINDYLRLHPDSQQTVADTLAYFDGHNFADKITCPIVVNIGLQDNVCPPETGYTLFNKIGARDKQLYTYDGHGHDAGRYQHNAIVERFFAQHLLS